MHLSALEILRCPFCGGCFSIDQDAATRDITGFTMMWGIIWCECAAFPVLDGIPVVRTGAAANNALELLHAGREREAHRELLGGDTAEVHSFEAGLRAFGCGSETDYFLHRFADPTFVVSDALLRTLGPATPGRMLDACGGTGHLARTMLQVASRREAWLADLEYWKLWLGKRFICPEAQMVCCDANQPLPFARKSFGMAFCSDAMNYVWQRRLFANELVRLTTDNGLVLLTHVHNALRENPSAGMPLSPTGYQRLFEGLTPVFYGEDALLASIVAKEVVPLTQRDDVSDSAAMDIILTSQIDLLRSHEVPSPSVAKGEWRINPLYQITETDKMSSLTLKWPGDFYEQEFGSAKAYLPEQVTLANGRLASLHEQPRLPPDLLSLAKQRVLLDLPKGYLTNSI